MAFHYIRGDAPGEFGENMSLDTSVHPPRVLHCHYTIDAWTGGDLMESFPVFVVTDRLAKALSTSSLRSFEIKDAEISIEPEGEELREKVGIDQFPTFHWLDVTGIAGRDDIGVTPKASLVVSDRALEFLRQFNLDGCDIEEYAG